jgi:glucose-1-phosphate cytidylyltransferase
VREHVESEEYFLANYADGLTDLHLPDQIRHAEDSECIASFLVVRSNLSYHFLSSDDAGRVTSFRDIAESGLRVNGGFFVLRREIFDYMEPGNELVLEPFNRLIEANKLIGYNYDGFWVPMDTAKDKKRLDDLHDAGDPPWFVWRNAKPRRSIALSERKVVHLRRDGTGL